MEQDFCLIYDESHERNLLNEIWLKVYIELDIFEQFNGAKAVNIASKVEYALKQALKYYA